MKIQNLKIGTILVTLFLLAITIQPIISGNPRLEINTNDNFKNELEKPKALVLHPFQWQAEQIAEDMPIISEAVDGWILRSFLQTSGFEVEYKENEEVDLNYIKNNLSSDFLFFFGHGKQMDSDGDFIRDAVFICSGEIWTEQTPIKHKFEFDNGWIKEGLVDGRSIISFSPKLIQFYYGQDSSQTSFNDALIYIATCDSLKDNSMAKVFVDDCGASAFIGWSGLSNAWFNVIDSHIGVFLLCKGWSVDDICNTIGYGWCPMHILRSCKLDYYGDGSFSIC